MTKTPFTTITYSTRWQHWMFFILIPVGILLSVGMYWGIHRAIEQEQRRFTLDFLTLVDYIDEQESFLKQLRDKNEKLVKLPFQRTEIFHKVTAPLSGENQLFEAQESTVTLPFSLICETQTQCFGPQNTLSMLGSYLSDFYSSFWASSTYPASTVFFFNKEDDVSISIPAVNTNTGIDPITMPAYQGIIGELRKRIPEKSPKDCQLSEGGDDVVWFSTTTLPKRLVGFIPAGLSPRILDSSSRQHSCIYAATLMNRSQPDTLTEDIHPAPKYLFWLQYRESSWLTHQKHGLLIGEGELPEEEPGLHYTLDGLVLKVTDKTGNWTGVYRISYSSFFIDNIWLLSTTIFLLLFSIAACLLYMRWYNLRVLLPAQKAQHEILESDAFNRTLLQTAPIALCLIARDDGRVIFANDLALEWLGADIEQQLPDSDAMRQLLSKVQYAVEDGTIEQLEINDQRTLYVAYAPTRYLQQNITLCAFTDVSSYAEIERNLTNAREAADEANEAKSTFLATMSHEIRTPLYGVLGTMELLSLTALDDQQRQYFNRIEDASLMLQKIISDILDFSKIEAGQLQLDMTPFSLMELVQNVTGTYAGMANNKGLLLFSLVSTDIPKRVVGDPARIRQILSNLISNAIKFTDSGHVIIRLSQITRSSAKTRLRIEICDSGIGISLAKQAKLFTPFYITNTERNTAGGTGLGLSICAHLAELMNTKIQIQSESMMGSIFFFELDLDIAPDTPEPALDLTNATILVRTPHPELTTNICDWLKFWGAQAYPVGEASVPMDNSAIFVEITRGPSNAPADWHGQYIGLSLSGETSTSSIDAYRINSIGFGINQLIHNISIVPSNETLLPRFKLRILIAEDNPLNQITLREQLKQLECEVDVADNGEEALALWDISPYDIILTDVNMPYLNGYELSRKLRSEGVTQPIIGVTANAMRDEEQRCFEAGMNAWLVKPIKLRKLAELLSQHASPDQINVQGNVEYHSHLEPDVLHRHRDIFLQTMWEDWHKLHDGIMQKNADMIDMTLHRMRGALVLAKQIDLSSRIEMVEHNMRLLGLDEIILADVVEIEHEIHLLLTNIETESISGTTL
ncbi:response regulator [Citrobacter sp. JGM124]|nr:response regulator [Citrobacter sp. JGM124]